LTPNRTLRKQTIPPTVRNGVSRRQAVLPGQVKARPHRRPCLDPQWSSDWFGFAEDQAALSRVAQQDELLSGHKRLTTERMDFPEPFADLVQVAWQNISQLQANLGAPREQPS
jgi:hypothetical protein